MRRLRQIVANALGLTGALLLGLAFRVAPPFVLAERHADPKRAVAPNYEPGFEDA